MHWEYVIPGYLAVFGSLAIYTVLLLRKARRLAAQVPPEKRRFLHD
mgnify:CR=1 FL=1|jgi:hypothetical protein